MDPFAILGLDPRFDLDASLLEERHRELSRVLHPDKHAGASGSERRMSLSRAIEVNEAFRILKDPIRRAEKLFEQSGIPTGEASQSKASPALLMEMMEAREELADAARAKKLDKVVALGAAMQERQAKLVARLARDLAAAGADRASLLEAEKVLGELRYAKRYLDEVAAFEEALTE
jgi:molecular chaperone HscB